MSRPPFLADALAPMTNASEGWNCTITTTDRVRLAGRSRAASQLTRVTSVREAISLGIISEAISTGQTIITSRPTRTRGLGHSRACDSASSRRCSVPRLAVTARAVSSIYGARQRTGPSRRATEFGSSSVDGGPPPAAAQSGKATGGARLGRGGRNAFAATVIRKDEFGVVALADPWARDPLDCAV
jgi:hypothetical protein